MDGVWHNAVAVGGMPGGCGCSLWREKSAGDTGLFHHGMAAGRGRTETGYSEQEGL